MANSGSWVQFSREGITDTWQTGIDSDNPYVIRASDATNVVAVNQHGNTTISGNLDVGQDQAQTSTKTFVNHIGKQVMWKWKPDGLTKVLFILKLIIQPVGYYLLLQIRWKIMRMYLGNDIVYI